MKCKALHCSFWKKQCIHNTFFGGQN